MNDSHPENPKVIAAGDDGGWLHYCAICYCSRNETDGFVPDIIVPRLTGLPDVEAVVERLVKLCLFEKVEGGIRVHDYLDHQTPADQIKAKREDGKERAKRWRERKRNGVTDEFANAGVTDPETETETETEVVNNGHRFESFWKEYPNRKGRKNAEAIWESMTEDERLSASLGAYRFATSEEYHGTVERNLKEGAPKHRYIKHGDQFLKTRGWQDEFTPTETIDTGGFAE